MVEHVNFYENLKEAQARLVKTCVVYDGEPYRVLAITDHMKQKDGIFRVYLLELDYGKDMDLISMYDTVRHTPYDSPNLGNYIDTFMEANPSKKVLRKHMNSPHFNKFRPFPLGMCNHNGHTYYLERHPLRKMEQGLLANAVVEQHVTLNPYPHRREGIGLNNVPMGGEGFIDCVRGKYPSAAESIVKLNNPEVTNASVGFHRNFSFVRGPLGLLFLSYKSDIVGVLPHRNLAEVQIGRKYQHTKEVIEELNVFGSIVVL